MHTNTGNTGEGPREGEALAAILGLGALDDGSGFILGDLEALLATLDDATLRAPRVRVAALPLLADLKLGLGDDGPVQGMLYEAVDGALAGDAVARVVALRILRSIVRMEAVEMRGTVERCAERAAGDATLRSGLELVHAVLEAVAPGAHPLAFPRLPGRFADRVLVDGDAELLCLFADVENAVHGHREADRRLAAELQAEIEAMLRADTRPGRPGAPR